MAARKSNSTEEHARDALRDFAFAAATPLGKRFLGLYFPEGLPQGLMQTQNLRVETEVETNLKNLASI